MEKTWRWFGKKDKITLAMLKQIGVEGIVTALHDVPLGQVWTREKIRNLREYIESYGMRWSVVESLPVLETIKYGGLDRDVQIEVYKQSLRNLAAEGIHCICYNFMPVMDWARTDLFHENPNGDFTEASHLGGRADLVELVRIFEKENPALPMRVDHGMTFTDAPGGIMDESAHGHNPGYTLLGRMFALGQVQGVIATVDRELGLEYKQPGFYD